MLHNNLEPDRTDDNMSFKFSCYVFYHLKWYSFVAKLGIVLIYSSLTMGICLTCDIAFGKKVFKSFQFIFQKTRIKDCFTFSILDFDICLN